MGEGAEEDHGSEVGRDEAHDDGRCFGQEQEQEQEQGWGVEFGIAAEGVHTSTDRRAEQATAGACHMGLAAFDRSGVAGWFRALKQLPPGDRAVLWDEALEHRGFYTSDL